MDFFEVIEKRSSYRGEFCDTPVPKEHIEKILDAGIRAPSGMNLQPVSFIAVTEPGLRAALHNIVQKPTTATAPLIIVVATEHMVAHQNGLCFELEDYGAAVENLLLAITALGYASVWMDGYTRQEDRMTQIAQLLEVPKDRTVRCVLPVGVPQTPGAQAEKRPFNVRAEII